MSSPSLDRLSLNQITCDRWSMKEAADGCARAGLSWIGLWRHKIQEAGLAESKRIIRDSGLKVSSICRGGMFPAATAEERERRLEDNFRAVEEAAELGTDLLVLVCGPAPDKDIDQARKWVAEGIERLLPFAKDHGVKLGIEPLHPMYAAERSVIVTLDQALTMAEPYDPQHVGVVFDVFHLWWDPVIYRQIERAAGRLLAFHISDWIVPTPDMLMGRGMMGDGVIEIRRLREAVEKAGYHGPIEVEIFNRAVWDAPGDEVLATIKTRFVEC